jgi:branched-chain amino acid aminotransferase
LRQAVLDTIDKNPQHQEANVRIVVSGGVSADGIGPEGNAVLLIMVTPQHVLPAWWYRDGVKIVTSPFERFLPGAKSTNYLNAVVTLRAAARTGAIEVVYVDRRGRVLEGTTTNFFAFKAGRLLTPGTDAILPGITRQVVLKLLEKEFPIEVRDLYQRELPGFEEVFLTASNKEIVPVIQVDDLKIGAGTPGPLTRKVMQIFRNYTEACGRTGN